MAVERVERLADAFLVESPLDDRKILDARQPGGSGRLDRRPGILRHNRSMTVARKLPRSHAATRRAIATRPELWLGPAGSRHPQPGRRSTAPAPAGGRSAAV